MLHFLLISDVRNAKKIKKGSFKKLAMKHEKGHADSDEESSDEEGVSECTLECCPTRAASKMALCAVCEPVTKEVPASKS